MRETFNNYLKKLVASTKNPLTCPVAEQTREQRDATANSPLQGKITTPLGKADHSAHLTEEKRKNRRIPFVALALVVAFVSLCALSLLHIQPTALAHNMLALDATVTPAAPASAPQDQSVQVLQDMGNGTLGYGNSCVNFHLSQPLTDDKDTFCWSKDDFTWGDRDITCLYNDMHSPANGFGPAWDVNMVDKDDTKLNIHLDAVPLNQNTCTGDSVCVSDNASRNDSSTTLADQIGGDDILCGNSGCINDRHVTTTECGDPSTGSKQKEYDRFACKMTSDKTSTLVDKNWKAPSTNEVDANTREKRWWWSTGVAINPSAYDPNGALYLPAANLRAADIEPDSTLQVSFTGNGPTQDFSTPTGTEPECDASNHWSCPNSSNVIIYQYNGSLTQSSNAGNYEEAVPHYAPDQFKQTIGLSVGQGNQAWRPGSAYVPVYWVVCSGTGSGWAFPCSDKTAGSGPYGNNLPFITTEGNSQSLDSGQVDESLIAKDWLSGNVLPASDHSSPPPYVPPSSTQTPPPAAPPEPGHLAYTYLNDTVQQPGIQALQPYMLGFGFVLLSPIFVLIGYQFVWASWTLGRANAMETLGRVILSIVAIAVSYQLTAMLIELANTFNLAVVAFHGRLGYPTSGGIDNQGYKFTLQNQGENDQASFRGIVVPITRWGCVANDFVALLSNKFWTDAAGFVPVFGGIAKFAGNIANAVDLAKHIGEFITLILSINLCIQVFVRVVLLNYYVVTGPIVFGCWGLPGGVGQKVVSSWAKGFLSLLFAQTAQIFVLSTFPLILPSFPTLPTDRQFGILNVLFQALPRVLVLLAAIKVPTAMGTGATKAIAQAGTVAGGAVAAAGGAAMHTV